MYKLLSLTGGGYRGLYTAQVIADLEHHFTTTMHNRCDAIAGTSIGGIIALALAAKKSGADIVKAFKTHKADIFSPKPWYHSVYYSCKYQPTGLKSAIESMLGDFSQATLLELKQFSGVDLFITTVDMNSGETLLVNSIEKEYRNWRVLDLALATSAAPTFFPAHTYNKKRYIDGGVSCNMPDLLAAQVYSDLRAVPVQDLSILSVGTCYSSTGPLDFQHIDDDAGALRWASNLEYFIDVQAPLHLKQCQAIFNTKKYTRIDSELDTPIKLDDISKNAENALLEKAAAVTSDIQIIQNNALITFMR